MIKGLVYKDLKCLIKNMSPAYLMCFVPLFVFWGKGAFLYIAAMIIGYFCGVQALMSITIDEKSGYSLYYRLLPVSSRGIALSKYILMLLMMGLSAALMAGMQLLYEQRIRLSYLLISAYVVFIYNLVMIPVSLYFGVEKGKYLIILAAMIPLIFAGNTGGVLGGLQGAILSNAMLFWAIFVLINAVLCLVSVCLSCLGVNKYI